MDLEDFKKRVRRDDFERHKYWFVGAAAGILAAIVFQNAYFFLLSGVSLIGSGLAAIRGGKSAVTGIGVTGSEGSAGVQWSTRELENMTPEQQTDHANTTGGFLILMGAAFVAMIAYVAWSQLSQRWAASEHQALADAAGLVRRFAPKGTGLAASAREVCWSDAQAVAMCSDRDLVGLPRIRSNYYAHDLVYTPSGLVLASDLEVTWLGTFSTAPERLFHTGATALTALGSRVGWVSNTDVVIADLDAARPHDSWQVVAQVANTQQPLLALATDTVLYGPTENCALEWQDAEACAVPPGFDPCAVGSSQKQVALVTKRGELWRASARARFTRVASGLRGCLLAVNDRFAFVAGKGPITRVDLGTGKHATIFRDPAWAIALSDRMLYFRSADEVKGIRIDAPPL